MKTTPKTLQRRVPLLITVLIVVGGLSFLVVLLSPLLQSRLGQGLKTLTREGKRILGWEKGKIPPEEKRIREEVILKKMEETNAQYDWRSFASEYPRPNKIEPLEEKERMRILRESKEFKEMEKELKAYLRKKEDLFSPEPPVPPLKDIADFTRKEDKGAEKIIEKLLSVKEKDSTEKPLEENLRLGIKGPLASRKIFERPSLPLAKVRIEVEIELTLWVLPNGIVDRVVPSLKGDTEVEQIAIHYLKQWRFASLPKDHPQVEQWGTIPIRFKLR
jgi:hypothetical protein